MTRIRIPGKTFLAGEYAILQGATALLMTTQPLFEVEVSDSEEAADRGHGPFHPDSPAGKWISKNPKSFQGKKIIWKEAYGGRGGFGASTAQFLGVWLWTLLGPDLNRELDLEKIDVRKLLEDYWSCAWRGIGQRPSGADLVAQCFGGMIFFDSRNFKVTKIQWPWPEQEIFLIPTGFKLPTHEHLKKIEKPDFSELVVLADEVQKNIFMNVESMISSFQEYAEALKKMNLQFEASLELQMRLKSSGLFSVVKGCGALGVDVLFCLSDKKRTQEIQKQLADLHLNDYLSLGNLSQGVQIG